MAAAEFFVRYVQQFIPTIVLRCLIRWYMLYFGWVLRKGNVVVNQIEVDRTQRNNRPVTAHVEETNEQLYGNDPDFFLTHLGPKLKYSACEWPEGEVTNLAQAEEYTIRNYQKHAGLEHLSEGARVLELGCGWGSLSLTNAERYPHINFVSFSNSPQQIDYIQKTAKQRGLTNLTVFVEDYAVFVDPSKSVVAPSGSPPFDAVLAIETVEHAQNISALLQAISALLKPNGKIFVHSLLHQSSSFFMDENSWMGRNFFTGGSILALNSYFHLAPPELYIAEVIPVDGRGYSRTLLAWLELQEKHCDELVKKYGRLFYEGFRMFYILCAEAFAANDGAEYMCGYYVFVKR